MGEVFVAGLAIGTVLVLGDAKDHIEKLEALRDLGEHVIPAMKGNKAARV